MNYTKQIKTSVLNVTYIEKGNKNGIPVLLMHGFPYDIQAYKKVSKILEKYNLRIFIPYLRGFGETKFLYKATLRSGEQAALGYDLLEFMNALKIDKAILAGYDWGGRAACVVSALYPKRCLGLVSCNGYNIQNIKKNKLEPDTPENEKKLWYQYYFHSQRGKNGLNKNKNEIIKFLWKTWSPTWKFSNKEFNLSKKSFCNKDFVDVVIHSYRHRYGLAKGDPRYLNIEKKISSQPKIIVPTITIDGLKNGVRKPKKNFNNKQFSNLIKHKLLEDIGHNVPQESPKEFSKAILEICKHV